jgi:hypothetical protein
VAGRHLGEASRLAAATGAYLRFEDEAGQTLRPPKARTWARRGRTPVVAVSGKGSGRVSAAGMACYRPGARSRFFYRIRLHTGRKGERRSMSEADYANLITAAHTQLAAPLILVRDKLNTHNSALMRKLLVNFTRWVNRQDDRAVFEGGFLGLVHNRLVSPLSDVPERPQPRLGGWPGAPGLG